MYALKDEFEADAKQVEAPPGVIGYGSERYLEQGRGEVSIGRSGRKEEVS